MYIYVYTYVATHVWTISRYAPHYNVISFKQEMDNGIDVIWEINSDKLYPDSYYISMSLVKITYVFYLASWFLEYSSHKFYKFSTILRLQG